MDRTRTTMLLEQARGGSVEALNRLVERCGDRLLALIRLRMGASLRDRVESRDVLQATLLKAFQRADQFAGSDAQTLMGWLARIAENEIRDLAEFHGRDRRDLRRDASLPDGAGELAARVRSQVSRVILDEELGRVQRALETLAPEHREVILLRKFEELGFAEIGRRMERSPDACRMLLARALTALTLALEDGA